MLLYRLMAENRDELLAMAKERIGQKRPASPTVDAVREANLPAFLDAVIAGLRNDAGENPAEGADRSTHIPGESVQFDIDELVHEYGSLCYSVMEIAKRKGT